MSQNDNTQEQAPTVRADESELTDESLESVAGGCAINSPSYEPPLIKEPWLTVMPIMTGPTIDCNNS